MRAVVDSCVHYLAYNTEYNIFSYVTDCDCQYSEASSYLVSKSTFHLSRLKRLARTNYSFPAKIRGLCRAPSEQDDETRFDKVGHLYKAVQGIQAIQFNRTLQMQSWVLIGDALVEPGDLCLCLCQCCGNALVIEVVVS